MFKNNICARVLVFIIGIQSTVGLVSCGYYTEPPATNIPVGAEPSVVVKSIFKNTCIKCHDGNYVEIVPDVMNNPDGPSYAQTSEDLGGGYTGRYIVPGNPEESLIFKKINGVGGVGGQMPNNGAPYPYLTPSEVEAFRQWITNLPH